MIALASFAAAGCIVGVMWLLLEPPRPLDRRVDPYLARNWGTAVWNAAGRTDSLWRVGARGVAERLGSAVDGLSRQALEARLRQAGLFQDTDDPAGAFRLRQLADVGGAVSAAAVLGTVLGMTSGQAAGFVGMAVVVGVTRQRGRVGRAIEERRQRMIIEVYTVNQVLALRIRAGGGVIQAVSAVVASGRGEVIGELSEALRLHRAGMSAARSFRRVAEVTPEPACARTYTFLSLAEERGSDLGEALLSLAEDVRESRREAIRRAATRRRAAMLVPTIGVLAPVMLLFIGAPLPSLVLGFT